MFDASFGVEVLQNVIEFLVQAVLFPLLAAAVALGVKWLNSKTKEAAIQLERLVKSAITIDDWQYQKAANLAVAVVEQTARALNIKAGQERLSMAVQLAEQNLSKMGLEIDFDLLIQYIEKEVGKLPK